MGTTQTALEQNAATAVVFVLAIEGHGVLYCSDQSLTAAVLTSWTAYDWTVCRGGLEIPGEVTSKFVPFGKDASISPEPLSFRILDPLLAETMFATELATGELSRLKFDSQPDDTTIEAKDVSGFAASGNAFLGIEQFSYGSKTGADTLNVNDRGIYSPFAGNVDPILWGRRHQATILADANVAAPFVSDYPRVWVGKMVGLWVHRVLGGVVDTRTNADLAWSGRIADHGEDEDGHVRLSCIDVRESVRSTLLLNDQFQCTPKKGITIPSGRTFYFRAVVDSLAGGTWTNVYVEEIEIDVGTDIPAGLYNADQLASTLHDYLLANWGEFPDAWNFHITGITAEIFYVVSTGNKEVDIKVELPFEAYILFGWWIAGSTHLAGDFGGLILTATGYHATQAFAKLTAPQPVVDYGLFVKSDVNIYGQAIQTVENVRGTLADQYDQLPPDIKDIADLQDVIDSLTIGNQTWGMIELDGVVGIARLDSATQLTVLINSRLTRMISEKEKIDLVPNRTRSESVPVIRQIFLIQGDARTIIPRLFASTGTPGYNHATYDSYAANLGAAIPWSLLGDNFIASVNALWEGSPTFTLFLDRPTRLSQVLEPELQLRGAFLGLRAGQMSFVTPVTAISVANASYALTESNKVASPDNQGATRSLSRYVREHLINHIKVEFARTVKGTYREVLDIPNPQSITDHGEGSPLTIQASNHVGSASSGSDTIREIIFDLAAFVLAVFGKPLLVISRQTSKNLYRLTAGDTVVLSDNHVRDPATGAHGLVSHPGWALSHSFDWRTGVGRAEIVLLPSTDRTVYAPCADVKEDATNAGYDVAGPTLELKQHVWSESDEDEDGEHFISGDLIYVIERSPVDP